MSFPRNASIKGEMISQSVTKLWLGGGVGVGEGVGGGGSSFFQAAVFVVVVGLRSI